MLSSENDPPKHAVVAPIVKDAAGNYVSASSSSVVKSRSSSFKRVSFGNAKGTVVETFIYESVPTEEDLVQPPYSPPVAAPSTPTKIRVELVESQIPSCIAPPAEVSVVHDGSGVATAATSSSEHHHHVGVLTTQPQLPSLRKMDDHDNPFRPDGKLSHEVDPIVEVYKKRPFPSMSFENEDGVDVVHDDVHNVSTVQQQQFSQNINVATSETTTDRTNKLPSTTKKTSSVTTSTTTTTTTTKKTAEDSKNGGAPVKPTDIKLNISDGTTIVVRPQSGDIQHKLLTSPKAGQVEVVHLEEKKNRCACCVVQ